MDISIRAGVVVLAALTLAAGTTSQRLVIPAGTVITVRMIDGIDSTKTGPGERFRASIDDPVVVGDQVVLQRGADCTVQVVQIEQGKQLAIKLYDLTWRGKPYDVARVMPLCRRRERVKPRRDSAAARCWAGLARLSAASPGVAQERQSAL